jgi:hypothetical protein
MTRFKSIIGTCCILIAVSGCSTRPRYFKASLSQIPADQAQFEETMAVCRTLVGRGYKSNFSSQLASALPGTVGIYAGTAAALTGVFAGLGASIANGISVSLGGTATAASSGAGTAAGATIFPIVGLAIGFGVSRAIRSGREKKLKAALSTCLNEYHYSVATWAPAKRPKTVKQQGGSTSVPVASTLAAPTPVPIQPAAPEPPIPLQSGAAAPQL